MLKSECALVDCLAGCVYTGYTEYTKYIIKKVTLAIIIIIMSTSMSHKNDV
jgi:hypothetical protein